MAARQPQGDSVFTEIGIPSLGMDQDTVPRLLPAGKAPLLKNFLMDRPGVLPMRGPICEGTTWNFGASMGLMGVWSLDDKLLVSRVQPILGGTRGERDHWVAPYRRTTLSTDLRWGETTAHKIIDLVAGTVSADMAFPGGVDFIGLKSVRVGNYVYGQMRTNAGFAQNGFSYPNVDFLGRWNGTAVGNVIYTHGPTQFTDLTFHYNRLVVLGGRTEGAAWNNFSALHWTDPLPTDGTAIPDAQATWQDDVSGLFNKLIVGTDEGQDFGVALAHVGQNLCILKRRSLWMLLGNAPANWSVRQASNEVGCIDPRSVVEYDGGVYFMSERGFMFFDGVRVQNVSGGLNSTLTANALKQVGPQGVDGGYVRAALLDRGYVLVTTGKYDGTTLTATADTDAWLLHAPTGAWQQLSSGAIPSIIGGGRTTNYTYLWTDQKLVKANYLFNPNAAPAGTRGFDSVDSGATKFVIPSRWTTRALSLGTPPRKSKLQRIVADYYWGLANGGWQVTTNTRGATGVVNSSGTLPAPAAIAATLPARGAIDSFNETDEVYLDIAASSGAPATFNDAELHRVIIESQQSHRVLAAL